MLPTEDRFTIQFVKPLDFSEFRLLIDTCYKVLVTITEGLEIKFYSMQVDVEKGQLYIIIVFMGYCIE